MIASSPARCPEVETTMGPTPFLLLCPTGQTKRHAGACQVARPAKTDKEHLRNGSRTTRGWRVTIEEIAHLVGHGNISVTERV